MGKPSTSDVVLPASEYIGCVEGTWGSETSQYPQEEKTICDSVSSGERKRMRLNHADVRPGRGCLCGVVGSILSILPDRPTVRNRCVSRSGLERPVVEGESPVDENMMTVVVDTQVAAGP
jgi:hypothetical protein